MAPPPVEAPAELPGSWAEFIELLRYPVAVPLEDFVWELAERFEALHPPPRVAGTRPVLVDLDRLVSALVAHYAHQPNDAELAELRAGLEMADLPFRGVRPG